MPAKCHGARMRRGVSHAARLNELTNGRHEKAPHLRGFFEGAISADQAASTFREWSPSMPLMMLPASPAGTP
jgi:hypothetical protein